MAVIPEVSAELSLLNSSDTFEKKIERIEAWIFLLVFNKGKEVENPKDWSQLRKLKLL